eukprot:SAG31_NODE_1124_length_9772_cov_11.331541_3_plen_105_part_00
MNAHALALVLAVVCPNLATAQNIAHPAGNGYQSSKTRLPKWQPQWSMALSTIVMPCNDSGYHSVEEASSYGLVSYDWSNAKQVRGYFLVFVPTIREIRDFYREM